MKKLADTVEYIGRKVTGGYKRIEEGVVNGYRKMENGAVQGFQAVTDKCVEVLFAKSGETAAQAKQRLIKNAAGSHNNHPD